MSGWLAAGWQAGRLAGWLAVMIIWLAYLLLHSYRWWWWFVDIYICWQSWWWWWWVVDNMIQEQSDDDELLTSLIHRDTKESPVWYFPVTPVIVFLGEVTTQARRFVKNHRCRRVDIEVLHKFGLEVLRNKVDFSAQTPSRLCNAFGGIQHASLNLEVRCVVLVLKGLLVAHLVAALFIGRAGASAEAVEEG